MLAFTEVDNSEFFVGELFRRTFGDPPPTAGHHFVAFGRDADCKPVVLGYTNFQRWQTVALGGGAITDARALRRLSRADRERIASDGGVYFQLLSYATGRLLGQYEALFGYCGNTLAEAIDLRAGFCKTRHRHLLVLFAPSANAERQDAMIDAVAALGPF